jgi:hypothetical protein
VDSVIFEFGGYNASSVGYSISTPSNADDPLKSNLFVRISYFNDGKRNIILKLETE